MDLIEVADEEEDLSEVKYNENEYEEEDVDLLQCKESLQKCEECWQPPGRKSSEVTRYLSNTSILWW